MILTKNNLTLIKLISVLLLSVLISACGQDEATTSADLEASNPNAPAIGTDIKDVVKNTSDEKTSGGIKKIMWDDLIPKGFEADRIIDKYREKLDSIEDGTPEEQALLDKIMIEFNNAPSNEELDGIKVKIPGFISPLSEVNGMVNEFLLVPYFGSCIHSPPPPVNQTVLVEMQRDKSIPIEDIYEPVWVIGEVQVKQQDTDLAKAGYFIQNAKLEAYKNEKETRTVPNLTE
ncbi:MAG: Putative lipoprotein [uncultured Thiotrichaceae bacterium]|uniref:Lipoprotein n=1 Tax=uncultured Thiotrichaceae bacterium TaxID=298394 RepID=A0A6S6TZF6_9GAMM|nr:MAG: Putative lipoprotein [uncultured Thiotrichaceae bacterium]